MGKEHRHLLSLGFVHVVIQNYLEFLIVGVRTILQAFGLLEVFIQSLLSIRAQPRMMVILLETGKVLQEAPRLLHP